MLDDKLIQFKGTIYENGYGLIAKKVMKDPCLSVEAKAIYAYLCAYAGNNQESFPGEDLIKHELSIGRNRFYKYLKELISSGYIIKSKNRDSKGHYKSNLYSIEAIPCTQNRYMDNRYMENRYIEFEDATNNNITNNNITNNSSNKSNQLTNKKVCDLKRASSTSSYIYNKRNHTKNDNYVSFFENNFHMITPHELQILESYEDDGIEPAAIVLALQEAVENSARDIRYVSKILNAWLEKGIKTVDQVMVDKAEFERNKNKSNQPKQVPEVNLWKRAKTFD